MREGTAAIPQTAANRSQMSAWAADEVEKAVMAELVPEELQRQYTKPCTRQEFCQLVAAITQKRTGNTVQQLIVYRGGTDSSFTDTDNADVLACASLGIVNGVGNGRFAPDAHITREQAATMLVRAAGILDANTRLLMMQIVFRHGRKRPWPRSAPCRQRTALWSCRASAAIASRRAILTHENNQL